MIKWQILLIKEIRHLFRDTKTIIQTVVVPTFLTPLLITGIVWYISSIAIEESKKDYEVALYDIGNNELCLLYTSPSPRDRLLSRMPSSA